MEAQATFSLSKYLPSPFNCSCLEPLYGSRGTENSWTTQSDGGQGAGGGGRGAGGYRPVGPAGHRSTVDLNIG